MLGYRDRSVLTTASFGFSQSTLYNSVSPALLHTNKLLTFQPFFYLAFILYFLSGRADYLGKHSLDQILHLNHSIHEK